MMTITRQTLFEYRARVGNNDAYMPATVDRDIDERIFVPEGAKVIVVGDWQPGFLIIMYDGVSLI